MLGVRGESINCLEKEVYENGDGVFQVCSEYVA